ncbi:hypothetical protein BKA93DRAFT_78402 [Sparassis latifolia]|uniref:F-box domain-containing protein n=1 Tax=Sparassis crispa TaxID=139825 RepID=A0A401H1Z7_9APHY|nr:hypothetical protein SCP_1302340 [Sparassis crispa]GBE88419.1 hypothetical protein SCP_1302340 [Sparassis crispa]
MPGVIPDTKPPSKLPPELVEYIIEEAWLTCSTAERWELYSNVCRVSPDWHAILLDICLQFVIIDVPADIEGYRKLMPSRMALRDNVQTLGGGAYYSSKPSHLCLTLRNRFKRHVMRDSYGNWSDFYAMIHPFVPNCTSVHIVLADESMFEGSMSKRLFSMLSRIRNTSLYLTWAYYAEGKGTPDILLPAVTYLRIQHYPQCSCRTASEGQHEDNCLSDNLLSRFPNLRHLHLDSPFFLKYLRASPTLETVTLDAPPSRVIATREPMSSLVGWNIGAGLNRGFLKGGATSSRRRILVNTGTKEPMGWSQAQIACDAHGVVLERRCIFEDDPTNDIPDQHGLWKLGYASGFHTRS